MREKNKKKKKGRRHRTQETVVSRKKKKKVGRRRRRVIVGVTGVENKQSRLKHGGRNLWKRGLPEECEDSRDRWPR